MRGRIIEVLAVAGCFLLILAIFVFGIIPLPLFPRIPLVTEMIEDVGTDPVQTQTYAVTGEETVTAEGDGNAADTSVGMTDTDTAAREQRNQYILYAEDVSWAEACALCRENGGHLLTLDSPEEAAYVVEQLNANYTPRSTYILTFYLGARRKEGGRDYYNVDSEGRKYGSPLTGDVRFQSFWHSGEPSLEDGTIQETCLALVYEEEEACWKLEDVADDIVKNDDDYSGRIGYICEVEQEPAN